MRKKLLFSALVTFAALVAGEVVVRRWTPRPGFRAFPEDQPPGLYIPHPSRSFTYAPGYVGRIDAREYKIDVAINSLGLRDDPVDPHETIDVLAVGDSFTVGFGVEAGDAWPAQLEQHLNSARPSDRPVRVLNAGVSAYGLPQVRLMIEDFLYLKPKIVALGLYPAGYWRLANPYVLSKGYIVSRDSAPHYDVTEGGFVYTKFQKPALQRAHLWTMKHCHTGAMLLEALRGLSHEPHDAEEATPEERMRPFVVELERIRVLCQSRGVGLVVLLVNHQSEDGGFNSEERAYNAILTSFCARAGITVFDPVATFTSASRSAVFRIGGDAHWSRRAHLVAGRALGVFFLQQDWIRDALGGGELGPSASEDRR